LVIAQGLTPPALADNIFFKATKILNDKLLKKSRLVKYAKLQEGNLFFLLRLTVPRQSRSRYGAVAAA